MTIKSALARAAVYAIYLFVYAVAAGASTVRRLLRLKPIRRELGKIRVLVTGTFYNEGWIRAHLVPLAATPAIEEVLVVCDRSWPGIQKVSYILPGAWLRRFCGRSAARILTVFTAAMRSKPDLLMGYHIMPNSLVCLAVANLIGARSAYQMTGGSLQLLGGGTRSENSLLRHLGRDSALLEKVALAAVRRFDLVVVRGSRALEYARQQGLGKERLIITAGIDTDLFEPGHREPSYDLIYVSRLVPGKGLEYFLQVVHELHRRHADISAAIIGEGPLKQVLLGLVDKYGLGKNVALLGRRTDVHELLKQARVFTLASPSEGMSIALLEAMSSGLPAAVTKVGDLEDAVEDGVNGILLRGDDQAADAYGISRLLHDAAFRMRMSSNSRRLALERFSVQAIADRWSTFLVGGGA